MTDLLTAAQMAATLGKSPAWVQTACRAKKLPHVKVGKTYRFTAEQVAQILALLTVEPAEPDATEQSWDLAPGRRSA